MTIKKIKDSSGQEHGIDYEALENKPIAVANYVYLTSESAVTIGSGSELSFDLSSYLPNDGCNYLVSLNVAFATSNSAYLWAFTDLLSDKYSYCVGRIITYGSRVFGGSTTQVLVGPGRTIGLYNSADGTASGVYVRLVHYIKVS